MEYAGVFAAGLVMVSAFVVPGGEPKHDGQLAPIENSLGMKLAYIPPGTFKMGSIVSEPGHHWSEHQVEVQLTRGFYIAIHETRLGDFKRFVQATGYQTDSERIREGLWGWDPQKRIRVQDPKFNWRNPSFPQTDEHPVVNVSWNDAQAFIKWLNELEDHPRRRYRLPTEAEWEYACRAGTETPFAFGDNLTQEDANFGVVQRAHDAFRPDLVCTRPAGSYRPNRWGLHDMHGNVNEWVEDFYELRVAGGRDPIARRDTELKVFRGGAWLSRKADRCRSAARDCFPVAMTASDIGFRVVLEPVDEMDEQE